MVSELEECARTLRECADPALRLVIAGEGNASWSTKDGRLFVTPSGSRFSDVQAQDFIEVDVRLITERLASAESDAAWAEAVVESALGPGTPTVEVGLHVVLAHKRGPGFFLHTHPTAVLTALAGGRGGSLARDRLFPDHVVLCGQYSALVPYIDPGLELARHVAATKSTATTWLLDQHGMVAFAASPRGALDTTLMTAKAAEIINAAGQPVVGMTDYDVRRIATRKDEAFRRAELGQ